MSISNSLAGRRPRNAEGSGGAQHQPTVGFERQPVPAVRREHGSNRDATRQHEPIACQTGRMSPRRPRLLPPREYPPREMTDEERGAELASLLVLAMHLPRHHHLQLTYPPFRSLRERTVGSPPRT